MKLMIGARLVGGFLIVVALIAIIGMIALGGLRQVASGYDQALHRYADRGVVALELLSFAQYVGRETAESRRLERSEGFSGQP